MGEAEDFWTVGETATKGAYSEEGAEGRVRIKEDWRVFLYRPNLGVCSVVLLYCAEFLVVFPRLYQICRPLQRRTCPCPTLTAIHDFTMQSQARMSHWSNILGCHSPLELRRWSWNYQIRYRIQDRALDQHPSY